MKTDLTFRNLKMQSLACFFLFVFSFMGIGAVGISGAHAKIENSPELKTSGEVNVASLEIFLHGASEPSNKNHLPDFVKITEGDINHLNTLEDQTEAGGQILVISSSQNPFSKYVEEILLAEGLNQFSSADISELSTSLISNYRIIILGEVPVSSGQISLLTEWTQAGGMLIALRPDLGMAPLFGLTPAGGVLEDKYLLIHTSSGPGKGLVNQTIQFHSAADLYSLNGATSLATLYSGPSTSTTYPAVTANEVGENGGKAVAFTYDLARSVVYTRQGNPAWAGQERDGQPGPIRSNDLFYPDYVDLNKVAIPQADEQQRLLANILVKNSPQPIPRFWYLPRGLKAAVVMTGDDHANGGTKARFNQYIQLSEDNSAEAIKDWRAIRGSSYIYPNTPISDAEAKNFEDQGFEIALHLNTYCENFTPTSLAQNLDTQLADFNSKFPSLTSPITNRTHCITFSDWATQPKLESERGIRLDANYYYWSSSWVQNRPGMFTGSGFPMKFADLDGTTIDNYQLVTQMTDESGQTFPYTIDQLLDKALGAEGYYGVFCANMHTDADFSDGSDKIVASAKARNVPVISSKQLLLWLDGRNGSSFDNLSWNGSLLDFSVSAATGAYNLEGMLPVNMGANSISSISVDGSPVPFRTEIIKGINYAIFTAKTGQYQAAYEINELPEVIVTSPLNAAEYPAPATITIEATAQDPDGAIAKVEFFNGAIKLGEDLTSPYSFEWNNVDAGTYSITATATDDRGGISSSSAVSFTVTLNCPCTVFNASDKPSTGLFKESSGGIQLGMKFRASIDGYASGIRFYKQEGHTGTNTGQLYSADGNLMAQVTFDNETASGWQQASFSSPVPLSSNTTYIISYHSSNGYYSANTPNFSTAIEKAPLKALANGEDGPNGIYLISNTPAFPTSSYQGGNYWVDVVFDTEFVPGNTPPVVNITSPANNATFTAPANINLEATATDADGTVAKVEFFNGAVKLGEDLDVTDGWKFQWQSVAAGNYNLSAKATDNEGLTTTSEAVSITVNIDPENIVCPCTVFEANEAPVSPVFYDNQGIQLGMKFRTTIDGFISGVRFYKQVGHLGTNIGQLYSKAGILLAEATFENETESGWQEVSFISPVAINANTTYIISYHSSNGYYAANNPDFSTAKINGPITGLANGEDGPNGVFLYSSTPGFPVNNFAATNYWVDAVFIKEATSENSVPAVAITSPENNATYTSPATVTITASASDTDGTVTKVEFFNGTAKLGEDLNGSDGWSYSWNEVATGNYVLTAKATDDKGAVTTSGTVNIVVADPNATPIVAITSPEEGATFSSPAIVTITASASDTDGSVTKVEFFNGATKLGEDLNGSDGWSYSWNDVAAGNYSLTAKATDEKEAATTSEAVNIVVESLPVPVITSFSPNSGAVGTLVTIIGQNLSSASRVTFGPASATIFSNTDTQIEVLVPPVNGKLPANVKITVSTPGGNSTHSDKFTITSGTTITNSPPSVSLTSPVNGATFSEPASINLAATASDSDGSVAKVEFYSGATHIGEDATAPYEMSWNNIPAGTYSLTARAIDDKGAVTHSVSVSISVTNPNNALPVVEILSPENNAVYTAPASVNISANATDPDGTVSKVEFFNGTTRLAEFVSPPFEYNWINVSGGNYTITIRATDDTGAIATSSVNISVDAATEINAPANLTAKWVSGSQVDLSWTDNSFNETGFILERATKSDFTGKVDQIILPENGTTYQDQNLNNKKGGGVFYYRIKAINGSLSSPYSNVAEATQFTAVSQKEAETLSSVSTADIESSLELTQDENLIASPNPTSGRTTIEFILGQSGNYIVSLYNNSGAFVSTLSSGYSESGIKNTLEFDGTQLADGSYLIRLESNTSILTFWLLISK